MKSGFRPVLLSLLACAVASTARAEVKPIRLVRVRSEVVIACPASAIWRDVTDTRRLVRWMPLWNQPSNRNVSNVRIGSVLDFVDEWNNRGRSVVTFLGSGQSRDSNEIRFTNEPTHGEYMCRTRMTLTEDRHGTTVQLTEEYTDESTPRDVNATARTMQLSLDRALATLKRLPRDCRPMRM